MPLSFLRSLVTRFAPDMGIDLGTANTLVHVAGQGILLREPSVIALERESGKIVAVGDEAKRMLGRTPGAITTIRPLKDGVIADFDQTERMLRYFIGKVTRQAFSAPRVVVGIPCGVTEVEERAVREAARKAGARDALVIDEPLAAAIGAGLPVMEPAGFMIADIGGGTTEVALIALGGIVSSRSIRIAGDEMDEAVAAYVRRTYNLHIGDATAEAVKIEIGSAFPSEAERAVEVRGRDLVTGMPRSVTLTSTEVREALQDPVYAIVEAVKLTLEECPPELAGDIMDHGIVLAGGGALLAGLDRLTARETSLAVRVAPDPLSCVVSGAGRVLEQWKDNPRLSMVVRRK